MSPPELLAEQGLALLRAGQLLAARGVYLELLALVPEDANALFRLGLLDLQAGRLESAIQLLARAQYQAPQEARYQLGLGHALVAAQRWSEAAIVYRYLLEADPASAEALYGLGISLHGQTDFAGSTEVFGAYVQQVPGSADAYNHIGIGHRALGRGALAETAFRQALAQQPNFAPAMSNLGNLLAEGGHLAEALDWLRRARALAPVDAVHAINLAVALCRGAAFAEAEAVLHEVAGLGPANAELSFNLGNALQGQGRSAEAAACYEQAVRLSPGHVDALVNLGNARKQLGEYDLSLSAYQAALRLAPDSVAGLNNVSCLLQGMGRVEEAERLLRQGLSLSPAAAVLHNNLGNALKAGGELEAAIASFRRALELDPDNAVTHSNLVYNLSFQCTDAGPILQECQRWNERHAAALAAVSPQWAALPGAGSTRRLRIGYLSPYFFNHCQSFFTLPLLRHHDREAFEIVCYFTGSRADAITSDIRDCVDQWREVASLDDDALDAQIRADGIDVLVDLTMHMAEGRLQLFARRPAPVQITWLAYPGTTGVEGVDFRLTDPRLDPPGTDLVASYSEHSLYLPETFWCYDPLCEDIEPNALPALTSPHGLTLGCLNNPCKLTDATLKPWAEVMLALPDTRLLLLMPPGRYRQALLTRLAGLGVAAERIEFTTYQPRADYLRSYHGIDIGLDTFPYNGHTTSLDAFWMGVPVVSRVGSTCAGRAGLSQLHQLGLPQLAATSDKEFVQAAVSLASDLPRLSALRRTLRATMQSSPLMDGPRFARDLEAVLRQAVALKGEQKAGVPAG